MEPDLEELSESVAAVAEPGVAARLGISDKEVRARRDFVERVNGEVAVRSDGFLPSLSPVPDPFFPLRRRSGGRYPLRLYLQCANSMRASIRSKVADQNESRRLSTGNGILRRPPATRLLTTPMRPEMPKRRPRTTRTPLSKLNIKL